MSDILAEKLHEQRDFYLNTLKHLDFQLLTDPSEDEIKNIKKLQTDAIEQIKKIEQELVDILSKKSY